MGCCGSNPQQQMDVESNGSGRDLMHTNSMLFSKEAMREAKKSLKLDKGVNDVKGKLISPAEEDPDGVLMPVNPRYKLGDMIEYAADMSHGMSFMLEGGTECEFGYRTLKGRSAMPPGKPNQDSVVVFRIDGKPDKAIFGVFDGHGPFGEHASHFCRMEFHKTIKKIYSEKGDDITPIELLNETIKRIHEAFVSTNPAESGVDPQVSGTTLIVAMIDGNKIIVANVGDSRCVMGKRVKNIKEDDRDASQVTIVPMSDDHKPERESEKQRLEQTEAVLLSEGQLRGGPRNEGKTYICRKKGGEIIYGVLFTRSVGDHDAHLHLGISAEAEYTEEIIDPDMDTYLIIASDGVWDQMSNEECVDKCFQSIGPLEASEKIKNVSANRWDNDKQHSRRDDISVCVVRLSL